MIELYYIKSFILLINHIEHFLSLSSISVNTKKGSRDTSYLMNNFRKSIFIRYSRIKIMHVQNVLNSMHRDAADKIWSY